MLQLYKNQVITSASQRHVELRQSELDYYTNNLWTLSSTSTLFCGIAFSQLTTTLPASTPLKIQCSYVLLSALTFAIHLTVLVSATFSCIWAPGLAIRGPDGTRSVHRAIHHLKKEQKLVFCLFVGGLLTFLASNVLLTFAYYVPWVASACSGVLAVFGAATITFVLLSTAQIRVADSEAVSSRVNALHHYDKIFDLDEMINTMMS